MLCRVAVSKADYRHRFHLERLVGGGNPWEFVIVRCANRLIAYFEIALSYDDSVRNVIDGLCGKIFVRFQAAAQTQLTANLLTDTISHPFDERSVRMPTR